MRKTPLCKVCALDGKESNHRLGSYLCTAEHRINRIRTNFRTLGRNDLRMGTIPMETNVI